MRGILGDLRHAFRIYFRTPIASGLAVVVLAVAMAFVTAFLSMYVDVGLRGHPGFDRAGQLVSIVPTDGRQFGGLPVGILGTMAEDVRSLDAAAGVITLSARPAQEGEPPVPMELVTADYFPGLKPRLHSGRGFEPTDHDPEAAQVVVISYRYWRDVLGGADVLGTVIEIDFSSVVMMSMGRPDQAPADETEEESYDFQIVGIMAPEMTGTMFTQAAFWLPFERVVDRTIRVGADIGEAEVARMRADFRSSFTLQSFARRARGASTESVVEEIRARYADVPQLTLTPGYRLEAVTGIVTNINRHRNTLRQLRLFLGASVLIALVAAANVSLFLLARAPGRRRELGIRMAVGAPLGRLARQLASEAGLLVVAAAALGLALSFWLGNFLRGLAFLREAAWRDVSLLDWRVLALVGGFLLVLTLLVSLAPIVGLKRLGIAASSRQVAARASLAQRFAGALQISIAGTLGGAAIAFGWYLGSMTLTHPGYVVRDRYVVQFSMNMASLFNSPNMTADRQREIIAGATVEMARRREAIEAIPGVSAVAFGNPIPGSGSRSWTNIPDPADPATRIQLRTGSIDTRYVDVLGLQLLYGRAMTEGETDAVLVNQAFAQRFFGRDDVVGERTPFQQRPGTPGPEIVGVLRNLSFDHPSADVEPIMFRLMTSTTGTNAIVDTTLTPAALQQEIERISGAGEIEIQIGNVRPLSMLRDNQIAPDRARSWLTIGAATLVVLLAALGFYGTQRYLVTAGRREYAIRASIGAGPKALGRLVLHRGLMLGLPGLILGALCAFIAVAWLRDDFVSREISPYAVTLAVFAGLVLLLCAASLGPARQARRTQPAPLLREE